MKYPGLDMSIIQCELYLGLKTKIGPKNALWKKCNLGTKAYRTDVYCVICIASNLINAERISNFSAATKNIYTMYDFLQVHCPLQFLGRT